MNPPRRILVLLNLRAGAAAHPASQAAHLRENFIAAGLEARVLPLHGARIADACREALEQSPDAIVAAGGDGTVSTVAGALAGSNVPMGVLPLGTRNHFARDLRIPLDVDHAIGVIAAGASQPVDVGQVNGRVFVNNSSIGIYPRVVRDRDRLQLRLGHGKWLAMAVAAVKALRRFPLLSVRIAIDGQSAARTTPFVFVGNNRYEMRLFAVGGRSCLNQGLLSLYVGNCTDRFGMLRLALRAVLGRLDQSRDFEFRCIDQLWIDSDHRRLRVALDGEIALLSPPLHYRIVPAALRVFAPPAAAAPDQPQTAAASS